MSLTRRKPMRKVSKKRAGQNREYSKLRKQFLEEHPWCEVILFFTGMILRASDIHHIDKRNGKRLLDTSKWLAVSRNGHDWIHANPKLARERGWLI